MKPFALGTYLAASALVLAGVAGTGCATKRYVRDTVSGAVTPVERRVGELDKTAQQHTNAIDELEKGVSRADERAAGAEGKAIAAGQDAARANERAGEAGRAAGEARDVADRGMKRSDALEEAINNLDNYRMAAQASVLFGFGRADLDAAAKAELDKLARDMGDAKHCVIEVQGFTDRTGNREYNLELSRRRAAAVVRYLTLQHKIPLRRVHTLGYGSENPAADNATREGRKQNRRVEVRAYIPATYAGGEQRPPASSPEE